METSYALSQTVVPAETQSTFDLLFTFRSEASQAPRPPRRPLNLSLVIDRSGSMAGKPLQQALRAAEMLAEQLTAADVLSIVVYDDKVDTLLPPQHVTDKAAISALLHKVRAGGTTNLSGGWLRGCELVQATPDPEMIRRVLLLSDGQANAGITDPALLIRTARQKADAGIVTTALGFGASFNEDLMIGMAQAAGGNFYFIQSPDDAADVFRIEVESLSTVAAQNLTVTLVPHPGVQIAHVLSSYRADDSSGVLTLALGDVYDNEDKRLALEVTLEPQSSLGAFDLFKASFTYQAVENDAIQEFSGILPVSVPIGTVEEAMGAAPATPVIEQISRVRIARAKDEAIAQVDGGDTAGAVQTLRRAISDLQQKGLHERFEIAEEMDQLEHFAQRIASRQLDTESRKEMRDQSFQARTRSGRNDLSLRGVASGTARDLPTTKAVESGIELECFREGGKLRVRVISDGYDRSLNVQFPRAIREEGVHYVADALDLSTDGTFYRAAGTIRRLVLPGQENRYASTGTRAVRTMPPQAAKVSARTAADLETTDTVGTGVIVQCIKEGSKLRARVVSDGYDAAFNMRFPRDIREEGTLYVVDEVIEPAGGGQYIACGKIRRLVQ